MAVKWATAYYLLLLYATVALKPALPLISDFLSHTFAETQHIATVHAHHGEHHLEHEMAETGEDHDHEQNHSLPKAEDLIQVHLGEKGYSVMFGIADLTPCYPLFVNQKLPFTFLSKHSPPPKGFLEKEFETSC